MKAKLITRNLTATRHAPRCTFRSHLWSMADRLRYGRDSLFHITYREA